MSQGYSRNRSLDLYLPVEACRQDSFIRTSTIEAIRKAAKEGLISSSLDDLALDIPSTKAMFQSFVPKAISEGWLDASFTIPMTKNPTATSKLPATNGDPVESCEVKGQVKADSMLQILNHDRTPYGVPGLLWNNGHGLNNASFDLEPPSQSRIEAN
ncbi:hypothetical protein KIW84_030596 [Lathyrus oleraceus]|uniref:Uncharacterized protein n=1 Tax=Pisum sativum TaxID=3888 RepID=A0A9D4XQ48_PEA|nr:hypothetical protein KIW84_030596 [Pisum sativum]